MPRERCRDHPAEILEPLAQRRQRDAQAGEPRVQIDAKAARLDLALEILERRGDEPYVDRHRPRLADGHDLALLQDAQQRALRRER